MEDLSEWAKRRALIFVHENVHWVPLADIPDVLRDSYQKTHIPGKVYPLWEEEQRARADEEVFKQPNASWEHIQNVEQHTGHRVEMMVEHKFWDEVFLPGIACMNRGLGDAIATQCPIQASGPTDEAAEPDAEQLCTNLASLSLDVVGFAGTIDLQCSIKVLGHAAEFPVHLFMEGMCPIDKEPSTPDEEERRWRDANALWRTQIAAPPTVQLVQSRAKVNDTAHVTVLQALDKALSVLNDMSRLEGPEVVSLLEASRMLEGNPRRIWGFSSTKHRSEFIDVCCVTQNSISFAREILTYVLRLILTFNIRHLAVIKWIVHELHPNAALPDVLPNHYCVSIMFLTDGDPPEETSAHVRSSEVYGSPEKRYRRFHSANTARLRDMCTAYITDCAEQDPHTQEIMRGLHTARLSTPPRHLYAQEAHETQKAAAFSRSSGTAAADSSMETE